MKIDNIIHKGVGIVAFSAIFLLGSCSDDFLRRRRIIMASMTKYTVISVWRRPV